MSAATVSDLAQPELAAFVPVIERLRADGLTYFGMPAPTFRVERYIPRFYSDVLKLAVLGEDRSLCTYIQVVKPRNGESPEAAAVHVLAVFDTMTELHRTMAEVPGLSAVRPITCFPEHLAIVTEEAPGEVLLRFVENKAAWWPSNDVVEQLSLGLERVGEWLRRFHERMPSSPTRLKAADMREYLDVRLRILVARAPGGFSAEMRKRVLCAFDAHASRLRDEDLRAVPIHADFALGNIVVDGSRVAVLDFSVPASGAQYHDVAHLYMQLGLLTAKPRFRPKVVAMLQRALLRGFDPSIHTSHPAFELLLLQHVVCHFTGLVQSPASATARAYNWMLMRRHIRWLDEFVAKAGVP